MHIVQSDVSRGQDNFSTKNRLISVLTNKELSMEQADYRSITLPSADYKRLARMLVNRAS